MKIRTGFVSNSSSSSFIVAFDKKPESVEELQKTLFGDDLALESYSKSFSTKDLAEAVFRDINAQETFDKQRTINEIRMELSAGCPYSSDGTELPDVPFETVNNIYKKYQDKYDKKTNKKRNDELRAAQAPYDKIRKAFAKKFINDNKGKVIYFFTYSDNDGSLGSTLEHGGIFRSLNHIVVNKH